MKILIKTKEIVKNGRVKNRKGNGRNMMIEFNLADIFSSQEPIPLPYEGNQMSFTNNVPN